MLCARIARWQASAGSASLIKRLTKGRKRYGPGKKRKSQA
jgi:hypothetical protein